MKQNNLELTDEFQEPTGEWTDYTVINSTQNTALRNQKHVDIRSFVPDKPAGLMNMFFMDRLTMFNLDGNTLSAISHDASPAARIYIINNEGWSFGTVGAQSDRNNWNGISVECDPAKSATTTTQSVITQNG